MNGASRDERDTWRMPPVALPGAKPEAAQFNLNWVSAAGTGVFVAAILSGLVLRLSFAQWKQATVRTLERMKTPVIVIGQVLGLGFLTAAMLFAGVSLT